jgi:ketosteroid isomerase-like protein
MKPRVVFSLVGVATVLAILSTYGRSMGNARPVTSAQREAIVREIGAQFRETYDLSKPDVADRLLSLYPDSGRVVSATAGQMITTRDSLAEGIRYFWNNIGRNMRDPKWIWENMVVDVLAPDAAVMTATYRVPHLTPQGVPHVVAGAWTAVLVKRGGRWLIVQEHLSDAPATEVAPVSDTAEDHSHHDQPPTAVDTSLLRVP